MPARWRNCKDPGTRLSTTGTDAVDLLPSDCPYALDDLLTDGWYPANRRGLPEDR
jgi:hypothetical protein